jgi:rRNA maturation RNase YbeY
LAIRVNYHGVKFRLSNSTGIKKWIENVIREEEKSTGEITIFFIENKSIREINVEFLEHDYYTDVISFDYGNEIIVSGEIYISIDKVRENALKFGEGLMKEIRRVIIHGVLHLIGYEDSNEMQQKKMKRLENKHLETFYEMWNKREAGKKRENRG